MSTIPSCYLRFVALILTWTLGSDGENREHLATGGFRYVFKAKKVTGDDDQEMVVKRYKTNFEETLTQLNLSVTDYVRKQVQMHVVAKYVAEEFGKSVPEQFGDCFSYERCACIMLCTKIHQSLLKHRMMVILLMT